MPLQQIPLYLSQITSGKNGGRDGGDDFFLICSLHK